MHGETVKFSLLCSKSPTWTLH